MLKRKTLMMTLAATSIAGLAFAHGAMRPSFADLDADGDGQITAQEFEAHRDAKFAEADADNSGELSLEEMSAMHEGRKMKDETRAARMFKYLDKDSSGGISAAELHKNDDRIGKMIALADADENGTISEEEFDNMKGHGRMGKKNH